MSEWYEQCLDSVKVFDTLQSKNSNIDVETICLIKNRHLYMYISGGFQQSIINIITFNSSRIE